MSFIWNSLGREYKKVDKHDWELLDKQTQRLIPSRNDSVIGLIAVAMFFAGIALGAIFTHQSEPMRITFNDTPATASLQNNAMVGLDMHYYR